jgi:two-component system nitrate/nitrite response regulator NarL
MDLALYAQNAGLLGRWSSVLSEHNCSALNWPQVAQLPPMQPLLVHWQSLTASQRAELTGITSERAVIVLTDLPEVEEGRSLILAGVRGYANAYIHETLLPEVVAEVQRGNIWAVPEILQAILKNFLQTKPHRAQAEYDISQLSERETEVYGELMQGASNKEIARNLSITERTVKAHVAAILRKTGAPDRVHLIVNGVS